MNDKYDKAGILIHPIVKLESEMNQPENEQLRKCAELEALHNMESASLPSESFELAQLRVRVGEMSAEIERLQSVIDDANAQEPIYQAKTVGGLWGDVTAENYASHAIWRIVYARPIPAQQSQVATSDKVLFNGSHGHAGYVIEEQQSPSIEITKEMVYSFCRAISDASITEQEFNEVKIGLTAALSHLQQSPAVADVVEAVAKYVEIQEGGNFDPRVIASAIRGQLKYGDTFNNIELSPRITEQNFLPSGYREEWKRNVMLMWSCVRRHDSSIPSDVLDYMREQLLNKLNKV